MPQYRIVKEFWGAQGDRYAVQIKRWWFPVWCCCTDEKVSDWRALFNSEDEARAFIERHKSGESARIRKKNKGPNVVYSTERTEV